MPSLRMIKFLIFICSSPLLSYANARPELSLGYRYNQGHNSGGGSYLQAPRFITSFYPPTGSANSYFASQPSIGQIGNSGFLSQQTGFGGDAQINSDSFYQAQEVVQQRFSTPVISKHFYVHKAPSDDNEQEVVRHIQIGQPQKNYHVVFIDTSSSHSAKAKIIADIAPAEEKTAIYVLSKQNSALDIATEVKSLPPSNNKPEVFYIKYKTAKEAAQAQQKIQAQYDALGGTTDVSNEGQIPRVSAFETLADSNVSNEIAVSAASDFNAMGPFEIPHNNTYAQQTYLPPNLKFI